MMARKKRKFSLVNNPIVYEKVYSGYADLRAPRKEHLGLESGQTMSRHVPPIQKATWYMFPTTDKGNA